MIFFLAKTSKNFATNLCIFHHAPLCNTHFNHYKTHLEPKILQGFSNYESTSNRKLYPLFHLQRTSFRKICFKNKTCQVNFLSATYIVLIVYETYVKEVLNFVLNFDNGLFSNGRPNNFFMNEPSYLSISTRRTSSGQLQAPQKQNDLQKKFATHREVLAFNFVIY